MTELCQLEGRYLKKCGQNSQLLAKIGRQPL